VLKLSKASEKLVHPSLGEEYFAVAGNFNICNLDSKCSLLTIT